MLLGLGTGSTTAYFIQALGDRLRSGLLSDIRGVPTSKATAELARRQGIALIGLSEITQPGDLPVLDLVVDGADEVDPSLNMIKGLGRALLREKIVETHARQFIVVADETKVVPKLGTRCPLPVEIVTFEAEVHIKWLSTLASSAELWLEEDGAPVITDNGNYLALCRFDTGISDPYELAHQLAERPGIVEHGLFLEMASKVIVAGSDGLRILERRTANG